MQLFIHNAAMPWYKVKKDCTLKYTHTRKSGWSVRSHRTVFAGRGWIIIGVRSAILTTLTWARPANRGVRAIVAWLTGCITIAIVVSRAGTTGIERTIAATVGGHIVPRSTSNAWCGRVVINI